MGEMIERLERRVLLSGSGEDAGHPLAETTGPVVEAERRPRGRAVITRGAYRGTARVTVNFINANTFQPFAQEVYSRRTLVRIAVRDRALRAGQIEANPFNLLVTPAGATGTGVNGDVWLESAGVSFRGSPTRELLLQYWRIRLTADGFRGRLTNTHAELAASAQQVWAPAFMVPGRPEFGFITSPYGLYDARYGVDFQGRIRGTVAGRSLRIVYSGWGSANGTSLAAFRVVINARR
jgi:hypothetical protein